MWILCEVYTRDQRTASPRTRPESLGPGLTGFGPWISGLNSICKHIDAFGIKQKIWKDYAMNVIMHQSFIQIYFETINNPFSKYHLSWRTASPWFMTSSFKRFWNAGQNGGKSESHPGQLKYPKYLLFVIFRMPNIIRQRCMSWIFLKKGLIWD